MLKEILELVYESFKLLIIIAIIVLGVLGVIGYLF